MTAVQSLRELRRGVAEAGDAQVLQVVRMVDALAERGASDAVLDPVRPRLRAIHPARPLRFARLLFMPVDPLIVTPKLWHPGTPFLPRTALMVLARAVRAWLAAHAPPCDVDRVDALIEGASTAQGGVIRQAGVLVWPWAAAALAELARRASATLPAYAADWAAEGLPAAELQPCTTALAAILPHALALHDHEHGGVMLTDDALLDMLAAAQGTGPRAAGMMLGLLVIRVPLAAPALLAAARQVPALRPLADTAADAALDWLEAQAAEPAGGICAAAADALARQTALLDALTDQPSPAQHRRRVIEAKANLLTASLRRFETSLKAQLHDPLRTLSAAPGSRDSALETMEVAARTLRRFELEARRLGSGAKFDALLGEVEGALAATPDLSAMDRARLMEILEGPELALNIVKKGLLS